MPTENSPLAHLQSDNLGAFESIWHGNFNRFDFEVRYRSCKENANADGLSRRPNIIQMEKDEVLREI